MRNAYTIIFRWNTAVWAITLGSIALGVALFVVAGRCLFALHEVAIGIGLLIVSVMLFAVIVVAEGYAPQRLEVGDDGIVILRRYRSVKIPRNRIVSVERVPAKSVMQSFRLGGSGGLFGFFGLRYSRGIGRFNLYATEFRNLVMIRTAHKTFVVSCAEPEHLLGRFS